MMSKRINTGFLVVMMTVLFLAVPSFVNAQEAVIPGSIKNLIFVHGAWADGSSWAKVILRLEDKGFHVMAVQLPLFSLANDVATVQRAIALETGLVILVSHSYGGIVITEAGNDPKVSSLVYIAAYAPDSGESAFTLNALAPASPASTEITVDPQGYPKVERQSCFRRLRTGLTGPGASDPVRDARFYLRLSPGRTDHNSGVEIQALLVHHREP